DSLENGLGEPLNELTGRVRPCRGKPRQHDRSEDDQRVEVHEIRDHPHTKVGRAMPLSTSQRAAARVSSASTASRVRFTAARPWSIMPATAGAMSFGSRSAIQTKRERPGPSANT